MMRAIIFGIGALALATQVAHADLKEGTYAPDLDAKEWINTDEPISLTEMRGMVVVLYFWVSWSRGGEYFMPLINIVENHPELGRRGGVFLIGVTEADRARVKDLVKEERLLFPIALESKSAKDYDITSFPRVVVIDPHGKVAFTGLFGKDDEQNFISKIRAVLEATPPTRTHPREAAEARRKLDWAREAIRGGKYKDAFSYARNAYDAALTGDVLKTQCQDMLDLIEALGRDKLADAMSLIDEKKYSEAVSILRDVARLFRGLTCGKTAQKRLKGLEERYPEVKKVLDSLQHDAEARGLLNSVKNSLWDREFGAAYDALEKILKDFADTPVASDAKTIMARMEKNETVMGYVKDHKAEKDSNNWLGQARSYIRAGNIDQAKKLLRKVIDTYPQTRYAEEAYRELAQLK